MAYSRPKAALVLLIAAIAAASVGPSLALTCYNAAPGDGFIALDCAVGGITEDAACASYNFDCTEDDANCTPEEQAAGTTKPARICTTGKMCGQMQSIPMMYKDTQCCTTDECNLPPGMLDETTTNEEQTGSKTGSSGVDQTGSKTGSSGSTENADDSSTTATTATAWSVLLGAAGCLVMMANVA